MNPVIIIPARFASERLPAKALKIIGDKPLVQHVWERACEANIGSVYVATDHGSIADVVTGFGGKVIITEPSQPTGTDRVAEAFANLDEDADVIINVQGDLPFIEAAKISDVLKPIQAGFEVGTLVTFMDEESRKNAHCVKAIISAEQGDPVKRCHWFCRASLPYGYFHLGVYAYTKEALTRFCDTPQHPLELQEKLEQLRFLTMGMSIGASMIDSLALEVNTPEDLLRVRTHVEALV